MTKKEIKTLYLDEVIQKHSQDMTGKVAVITGTTSGTGFICAREIAKKGGEVVLLNRSSERAEAALKQLQAAVPGGKFVQIPCDLQDFARVRQAISEIKSKYSVIDVLCNNAGVMALKDYATKDGYDVQMQTNCLSHFLLTKDLFPLLKKSPEARVINHTSMARLGGPLEAKYFGKNGGNLGGDDMPQDGLGGPRWARYHQTKLANCCFTYGLKQKLKEHGITNIKTMIAHPGLSLTNLQATTAETGGMELNTPFMANAQSQEDGATGIIRACMDKDAKSGDFFGPELWSGFPERRTPEELLYDPENIRVNWEGCEAAVGEFKF